MTTEDLVIHFTFQYGQIYYVNKENYYVESFNFTFQYGQIYYFISEGGITTS